MPTTTKTNAKPKRKLSFLIPWLISTFTFSALWLVFNVFYEYNFDFTKILTVQFYKNAFMHLIVSTPNSLRIHIVCMVFVLLYFFIITTAYNLLDLLLIPFWLVKGNDLRKHWRGEVIFQTCFFPLRIIGFIFFWWIGLLFAILGMPNPLSKKGQKEFQKMRPHNNTNTVEYSTTNNTSTTFCESGAIDKFKNEYLRYKTSNGAYPVQNTYGLNQEEITRAIADAEAYLEHLGYNK